MQTAPIDATLDAVNAISTFLFAAKFAADRAGKDQSMENAVHMPEASRLTRLYGVLNRRGINLGSMSTDSQVLRYLPQLTKLIAEVEAKHAARIAANELPTQEGVDFLIDLRTLARRLPSARIGATQAPAKRQAQNGLIAVAQASATTGAVVYWRLHGDVELAKLQEGADAAQLDRAQLPSLPAHAVALTRAAKEVQGRNVLVRKHPDGGYAIVRERVAGNRLDQMASLADKVRSYKTLLGEVGSARIVAILDKLAAIGAKLALVSSRTNNLEIG